MKKRANGEGTIYSTIQKNKRKKFLDKICNVCYNCKEKCNRESFEKCDKCTNCTDCLKYCDRYYCYKVTKAQVSINKKRKAAGTGKNSKEVKEKKERTARELNKDELMKNGDLTLSEAMRLNEKNKLDNTLINENSYNRNLNTIKLIEEYDIANIKIYDLDQSKFEELLSLLVKLDISQSYLDKVYTVIHQACNMCKIHSDIFDNIKRNTFVSKMEIKEIRAFSLEEEKLLIDYINTHPNSLVNSHRSNISSTTIKNIIKFALATAMRIGEIGALDKNKNIDYENNRFIIEQTITRDLSNKHVIGNSTKTGRKKRKKKKKDIRYVPFDALFDSDEIIHLLEEQSQYNDSNLLFTDNSGNLIQPSSVNAIFKRICKKAGITQECNFHMLKHTGVTRMLENGMDIYAISEIVGTSVEVLSETYAHILDEFVEREIQKSKKIRQQSNLNLHDSSNSKSCKIIPFRALS